MYRGQSQLCPSPQVWTDRTQDPSDSPETVVLESLSIDSNIDTVSGAYERE